MAATDVYTSIEKPATHRETTRSACAKFLGTNKEEIVQCYAAAVDDLYDSDDTGAVQLVYLVFDTENFRYGSFGWNTESAREKGCIERTALFSAVTGEEELSIARSGVIENRLVLTKSIYGMRSIEFQDLYFGRTPIFGDEQREKAFVRRGELKLVYNVRIGNPDSFETRKEVVKSTIRDDLRRGSHDKDGFYLGAVSVPKSMAKRMEDIIPEKPFCQWDRSKNTVEYLFV